MNKKMRVFALMLVGVMSIGVLGGCSKAAEETVAEVEDVEVDEEADVEEEEEVEEEVEKGEPVDLVWWTIGGEPDDLDMVNEKISEYTREKLNVNVEIKYASWGDYGEKMSKTIQSGESYDLAFASSISGYQELANAGYFADLTDLLPEVTPDLNEFLPEDLLRGVTFDDKVMGVPAYKDSAQAQYWVWDKELVEELDIDYENIFTLQDLEPALAKIKENDPSGYPLIMNGDEGINGFASVLNNMDGLTLYSSVKYDDETATVISPLEDELFLENLAILHDWFEKGYISPDAATLKELPKYRPVFSAQGYPHADADWTGSSGYPVVSNMFFGPAYSTGTIQGSFTVISAGSEHIEESLQLLELVNTDEYMRNLLAFGVEDVHYEKTGDNTIELISGAYEVPQYSQGTFFNMYVIDPAPAEKWDDLKKQNEEAFASPALGFSFNTEPVQNEVAACTNIMDKYEPFFFTGTTDPAEIVPKCLEEMYNAGYQEILDEVQAQLDEYLGK